MPTVLSTIMSTPKKDSTKSPARKAPAAKKAPAVKKPAGSKAKAEKAVEAEENVAPAAAKKATKSAPKAEKKPAKAKVAPVEQPAPVKEPDDFEIMMGLAPEPAPTPVSEEEAPKAKESKKEKKSKHFTPQMTAAEMNEFFADDATLKAAFKSLLAIAKKNNGFVTSEDIENSLPPDEAEDNDQARLFERLHEVGVEVRDEEEYAVKPLSADELVSKDGRLVNSPVVQDKSRT